MGDQPPSGSWRRAVATGTIATTVLGFVLAFAGLPLSFGIAAIVGGLLSGRSARDRIHGLKLGATVGGLSVLAVTLISFLLVATGLLPLPPTTPTPDATEALGALLQIILLQVLAGASGGLLGFRFRPRPKARTAVSDTSTRVIPTRVCVQCGARISLEAAVCPACGGKQ
jgi:ribosomal protein L40E